jgi:ubiquitin C-terminal hydrolase
MDLFYGLFKNCYKCDECENESSTYDQFSFISLPEIDNHNRKIDNLMNKLCNEEKLKDKWYCDECKRDTKTTLEITFDKLPKVLLIRLKSLNYEPVEFTLKLKASKFFKTSAIYDLIGVSNHYGGLNGGHCMEFF